MRRYRIDIEILSDTLFGNAEGSAAVDSTTRAYKNGLPYIPAKTFKGLLKESAIEVLEITGKYWGGESGNNLIDCLFGQEGSGNNGKLQFENIDIRDRKKYEEEISENKLLPIEVLGFFTKIRHQTAMENGVAKKGSLRSSRVLKAGLRFVSFVETIGALTNEEWELLRKACLNLRRVGSNRNRGFGRVKVIITENEEQNRDKQKALKGSIFKLTLVSPALLPASQVDANTVSSEEIISGRKILGMLASAYIKKNNLGENAHEDEEFRRLFLDGEVCYGNAYPISNNKVCFPLGSHWVTDKAGEKVLNDYIKTEQGNFKAIGGIVSQDGLVKASSAKVLEFHNSRNSLSISRKGSHTRVTGSNKGEGIFYYECLDKGQEFAFKITGNKDDLKIIRSLLIEDALLRLGKSSSTNLGRIDIDDFEGEVPTYDKDLSDKVILTFISPTILKNTRGEFDPSLAVLNEYLNIKIKPVEARIRVRKVQIFQGKIEMQLPEILAIAPGSSIIVNKEVLLSLSEHAIGEFTSDGFGAFVVENIDENSKVDNLKKLLANPKNKDNEKNKSNSSMSYEGSDLVEYIKEYRETLRARKEGNEKGKRFLKSATMLMLSLLKDIKFEIHKGRSWEDAVHSSVNVQLKYGIYSIKVVEALEGIFGSLGDAIKAQRKEKIESFKSGLRNWIAEGLGKKVDEYQYDKAKVEYWLAYFNRAKIKNREK